MRYSAVLTFIALSIFLASPAADAAMGGKFTDGQLSVDLTESGTSCTGTLSLGTQQFPAQATENGNNLDGSFKAGPSTFPFTATLSGDTLTLTTGGKTYTLNRTSAPVNPLAADNPLAQPAPAAPTGDPLAGYTVVTETDSGKSLLTQKENATTVQAAFEATIPDLTRYFGTKPKIGRAVESVTDHKSGRATFTATFNGQPIHGFISCQLADKGAAIAVVYCRTDAPITDWYKLAGQPAPAAQAQPAPAAPPQANSPGAPITINEAAVDAKVAAAAKILGPTAKVYQYPDGTGTLILADGWTTQAQSAMDATFIKGPADQAISINSGTTIQDPDSPLMKMMANNQAMAAKNAAMYKQMGVNYNPPPPPPKPMILVAKFSDPLQAFTDLVPQLNQFNQSKGLPTTHIDQIIAHTDVPSPFPGGKGGLVERLVTRTTADGKSAQYHVREFIIMTPIQQGALTWSYSATGYNAPVATYGHDQPLMQAMIDSLKINKQAFDQVAQQRMQQIQQQGAQGMAMIKQQGAANAAMMQANHDQFMQQQQQRFDTGQAQHQAQEDSYAQHNAQFNQDELDKARNKDNFVETIQGTRTVYDTQTGQSTKVDLMTAGATVDEMNQEALDPNRFVQVPLRDEQDPIPAQ